MKISDNLYEEVINDNKKFRVLDDNYVVLYKMMPVIDDELEGYINNINNAKKNGINICGIIDYKLNNNTKTTYSNKNSYTMGVFIEERVNNINNYNNFYLEKEFSIDDYLTESERYIKDLEEKANMDIKFYDKLVKDIFDLNNYDLEIDPKPTNFGYDKDKGFMIIDPIPYNKKHNIKEYITSYLFGIVFLYGRPKIDFRLDSMLTEYLSERYMKCYEIIKLKILKILKNYNIDSKYIIDNIERVDKNFGVNPLVGTKEELNEYINENKNKIR